MISETLILYDIASAPPSRTFAPNPWKTRFALNFLGIPYRTQWVDMPDISALRTKLQVPANRTLPDGTPFHTLPVVQDPRTGVVIGDSFEIACYLDHTYPNGPRLFRPLTTGLTAAFNAQVDSIFTKAAGVCGPLPLNPATAEASYTMFAQRFGVMSLAELQPSREQHEAMMTGLGAALGELAKAYRHTGGTTDHVWRAGGSDPAQSQRPPEGREEAGVFLDGDGPAYADFIVGAWLRMFFESMRPEDWQRLRSWQGGFWGKVFDALEPWTEIK